MTTTKYLGLTQYDPHDTISFLGNYNDDMRKIDVATTSIASGILDVETRIDEVAEEATTRLDGIDKWRDITTTSISALKLKDEDLQRQVDNLVTTTSISNGRIDDLVSDFTEHVATSTSYMAGILAEVKSVETETTTKIEADRQRITVLETSVTDLHEKVDGDSSINTRQDADIAANTQRIEALENVDSETATTLQDMRKDMNSQTTKILTNTTNITSLTTRVTTLESDKIANINLTLELRLDATASDIPGSGNTFSEQIMVNIKPGEITQMRWVVVPRAEIPSSSNYRSLKLSISDIDANINGYRAVIVPTMNALDGNDSIAISASNNKTFVYTASPSSAGKLIIAVDGNSPYLSNTSNWTMEIILDITVYKYTG